MTVPPFGLLDPGLQQCLPFTVLKRVGRFVVSVKV